MLGPDGNVWFTLDTTAAGPAGIGKITPTGTVTIFNTPVSPGQGSHPCGLAVGPDNRIWYVDRNADWIGAFATSATSAADVTTYPTNHSNTGLLYITRGSDGRMWFNEFNRNALGAITTGGSPPPQTFKLSVSKPGTGSGTVTSTPSGNGLRLDVLGRLHVPARGDLDRGGRAPDRRSPAGAVAAARGREPARSRSTRIQRSPRPSTRRRRPPRQRRHRLHRAPRRQRRLRHRSVAAR